LEFNDEISNQWISSQNLKSLWLKRAIKVSRICKYPYTCNLLNVISLKVLDPGRQVLGVIEYHIHQGQHIIKVYA
jgi:hypothetical protein